MKLRKGQYARIKKSNQLVTIAEVQLIRKAGAVNRYCHVVNKDNHIDMWLDASELVSRYEECTVAVMSEEKHKAIDITIKHDYKNDETTLNIKSNFDLKEPINLDVFSETVKRILRAIH